MYMYVLCMCVRACVLVTLVSPGQFLCMGGRGLLEQQFRRFLSHKYPQYRLGGGGAEVGGAKKRKQSAPRKAFPPKKKSREDKDGDEYGTHTQPMTLYRHPSPLICSVACNHTVCMYYI